MRIERRIAWLFLLPLWSGWLLPSGALAQAGFENLDRIDSLVAMTVGANPGEPGGPATPVDRRLRLKPCPTTPKVEGPVFGAAVVSCAEIGWRIRVPLVPVAATPQGPATRNLADMRHAPARVAAAPEPAPEAVVKKGDPVELVAGNAIFSVSRQMVADEDGIVGQVIRVREDKKSPPVSARVERAGIVRAPTI